MRTSLGPRSTRVLVKAHMKGDNERRSPLGNVAVAAAMSLLLSASPLLPALVPPAQASLTVEDAFLSKVGDRGPLAYEEKVVMEERIRKEVRLLHEGRET